MRSFPTEQEINRAFMRTGLQRHGYTYRSAISNPAIFKGLICAVHAEQKRHAQALQRQAREIHQKGANQ